MDKEIYLEGVFPYKEEIIEEYRKNGVWFDLTYGELLDRAVTLYPEKISVVDYRTRLTYAELRKEVDRFAISLLEYGIKRYDRILLQIPNRYEFVVAFYAMQKIGVVPILAIPRHGFQEISNFVKLATPTAWVVVLRDKDRSFIPLIERVNAEFPNLKIIAITDGEAAPSIPLIMSMEEMVNKVKIEDYPPDYLVHFRPDPNDVAVLIPTGGTTGFPKMVPRTHNSLIVANRFISQFVSPNDIIRHYKLS